MMESIKTETRVQPRSGQPNPWLGFQEQAYLNLCPCLLPLFSNSRYNAFIKF
jgi:hypothetical protein